MRKIAMSLAALAVVFFASASAQMGPDAGAKKMRMEQSPGATFKQAKQYDWDNGMPVLSHHQIQGAPLASIGQGSISPDEADENWVYSKDAECDIHLDKDLAGCGTDRRRQEASCQHNDWGCDNKWMYQGKAPASTKVVGVEERLMATVVPAQVLMSNQTTVTAANECQHSAAVRRRNDTECFEVSGNFQRSKFDCQEQCISEASCFMNDGSGNANYTTYEGFHPVCACECNTISSQDMLDMRGQKTECMIFDDERHKKRNKDIVDPEVDVEQRINQQINKSIADILSEIIQNAIHQSLEEVITFD